MHTVQSDGGTSPIEVPSTLVTLANVKLSKLTSTRAWEIKKLELQCRSKGPWEYDTSKSHWLGMYKA